VYTLHSFLPSCYLYQREVRGVDSNTIYDWAKKFLKETEHLRKNSQSLLSVIDKYASHVQFRSLQFFSDNYIIVIALPAHTSHILPPLDVSIFSSYKSFLQREVHAFSQNKKVFNAFDITCCINTSYTAALNLSKIVRGFVRTGL